MAKRPELIFDFDEFNRRWVGDGELGGAEHQIYYDEGQIYKANNLSFHGSWLEFFHRLLLHEYLFPEAPLHFLGFVEDPGEGLKAFLSQPFIRAKSGANSAKVEAHMHRLEFVKIEGKENDYKHPQNGLLIEDLHDQNVLVLENEGVCVIDPVCYVTRGRKSH